MATYRYWRFLFKTKISGNWSADGIIMRSSARGANLATDSSKFSSSGTLGGFPVTNLVGPGDGNFWVSNTSAADAWVKYDFTSAVEINEVVWYARPDGFGATEAPTSMILQGSNNDSTWTDEATINNTGWTSNDVRLWTRVSSPDGPYGSSYRYFRVLFSSLPPSGEIYTIASLAMAASPGGANLATNGAKASASSSLGGQPASAVVDGDAATFWHSNNAREVRIGDTYWQYDFTTATPINELIWTPRNDGFYSSQVPSSFILQGSNDLATWTNDWLISGITGWAQGTAKTFSRTPAASSRGVIWFE